MMTSCGTLTIILDTANSTGFPYSVTSGAAHVYTIHPSSVTWTLDTHTQDVFLARLKRLAFFLLHRPVFSQKMDAFPPSFNVSLCGPAERHGAGKQTDLQVRFRSPFSSKVVVHGHCFVTPPPPLKWLTLLPALEQTHSGTDWVMLGMVCHINHIRLGDSGLHRQTHNMRATKESMSTGYSLTVTLTRTVP